MELPTREFTLQLISRKEKMESELLELLDVLKSNNSDMNQPLVDQDGYPRSDIDVYQVRTTRHKIICLQNDLRNLTNQIENALHNLHAQQREGLGLPDNKPTISKEMESDALPFAKVSAVKDGSPAFKAGLQIEDLILGFGTLRTSNFTSLQDVAKIVNHSVDREIPICVRRADKLMELTLTPKPWDGQGLLGCVLLPYDSVDR